MQEVTVTLIEQDAMVHAVVVDEGPGIKAVEAAMAKHRGPLTLKNRPKDGLEVELSMAWNTRLHNPPRYLQAAEEQPAQSEQLAMISS